MNALAQFHASNPARLPYFYEGVLQSPVEHAHPEALQVDVELTAPSGRRRIVPAFWDGGRIWRFRVDADEPGVWAYLLKTFDGSQRGWLGSHSEFRIQAYAGPNPLYRHGPLSVSQGGTHFIHRDGTPFFWLADTAWNGLLKADPADWNRYLACRREQGFTAVQCVMTHWRACPVDASGEPAFWEGRRIRINPAFFRRIDRKVAAIARHGLLPALVVLWALTSKDPGACLPEEQAIILARYIVARYGAFRPVWFLGGDGLYHQDLDRWRRIGRAVFGECGAERALVTLHPGGNLWVGDAFRNESWFDFAGYQSGHDADLNKSFRWIYDGPPAKHSWDASPKPVINLEPCYEEHLQYGSDRPFDVRHVRIASYYSLLASATAGVSYGHAAVWHWSEQAESPLDHLGAGITGLWHESINSPGAASMSCLKYIFEGLAWWRLRPAPELITEEFRASDPLSHVAAAASTDGRLALIYFPRRRAVALQSRAWVGAEVTWIEPGTARAIQGGSLSSEREEVFAPEEGDWLLLLRK